MEEALVFIVRLWGAVEPQTSIRAAVLRAGTDESTWFTSCEALVGYLERQVRAAAGTRGHAGQKEQS